MYHYIRYANQEFPSFKFLHFNDFSKQLDYLQKHFKIMHPNLLKDAVERGEDTNDIVLTFDDGLKDHYAYVLPELLSRGVSGIFYVPTSIYSRFKILDVHRLHLLLGKYNGKIIYTHLMDLINEEMLSHAHVREFKTLTYSSQQNDQFVQLVKRIINYFISYEYKEDTMDKLMHHFFPEEQQLLNECYIAPSEIKEMHDSGMVIGSHTVNHPVMSKLNEVQQDFEILSSFNYLETITGGLPYKTFCYPYGGYYSFTNCTEQLLKNHACVFSFNVEPRDITANDLLNRPHALPRYDCNLFPHGTAWQNTA